jgi:predicted ATP-binding protein involved in virulence
MHLKNITLTNFRCFGNITVDLHPQLTVFVAENGGGKTALLDGIAIGLSPILRHLSTADQRLSGPGIKDTDFRLESWEGSGGEERWGSSDFTQIVVEATTGLRWDNWRPSSQGKKPIEAIGQNNLAAYASEVLESVKTARPKPLPVFAYYGARRGWIEIPERLRASRVDYSHPTSALVDALKSLSDFKEMLKWFDSAEITELRANKGVVPEDFDEYPPLAIVRATILKLLGEAYEYPRFNSKHKFVVSDKRTDCELQISQLSQGYQAMLALGMDFARRLALANAHYIDDTDDIIRMLGSFPDRAPAIMLVDEIDLHLHPSWQQRVLSDLMEAFPNTQFIVTTHSPQVLTTVKRENIRLLKEGSDGVWTAPEPNEEIKGVESAVVLNDVMKVNPIPPVEEAQWLSDYTALIESGSHDSDVGRDLRAKLVDLYGEKHPVILDADRLIRFQSFKLRNNRPSKG